MKSEFAFSMPRLPSKILEVDKEYQGIIFSAEQIDPEWEIKSTAIQLKVIDGRQYYSVAEDLTLEMLENQINLEERVLEDYDIKFEEFSIELLLRVTDQNHLQNLEELGFLSDIENIEIIKSQLNNMTPNNAPVGVTTTPNNAPVGVSTT